MVNNFKARLIGGALAPVANRLDSVNQTLTHMVGFCSKILETLDKIEMACRLGRQALDMILAVIGMVRPYLTMVVQTGRGTLRLTQMPRAILDLLQSSS